MKVELTPAEAAMLHEVATSIAEQQEGDGAPERDQRKIFSSIARKLQGALERSGAHLDNSEWTIRQQR